MTYRTTPIPASPPGAGTSVVVIGGGVIGSATAWQLARHGATVVLVEQFTPGHDHGSSHGSSRIFRLAYPDADHVQLATRALDLWREIESQTGEQILTLTGAVDHGPEGSINALHRALTQAGHPSDLLSPTEAARRWPGLRFETAVLHHPQAGRADADAAVRAFQTGAAQAGAVIRHHSRVVRVSPAADHATVTLADHTTLSADRVVIAAGGWLPTLFADLFPRLPPIRVTQEQPIHLATPDPLGWPSFIHHEGGALTPGTGIYGLGSVDGVKIGHHGVGPVIDPRPGSFSAGRRHASVGRLRPRVAPRRHPSRAGDAELPLHHHPR